MPAWRPCWRTAVERRRACTTCRSRLPCRVTGCCSSPRRSPDGARVERASTSPTSARPGDTLAGPSMPPAVRFPATPMLLRWPIVGALLRWRHLRTATQIVLLLVAIVIVVARAARARQLAPKNLATVLTWIHYRGLLIGALLAAGNAFCGACPMILVRDLGRRLHRPDAALAAVAAAEVGRARRCSSACSSPTSCSISGRWPAATAWLVIGYFARGAARRSDVHRRGVLQARLPGRPVQLHRVHAVAAGNRRARACGVPQLHDRGLHQGPARHSRAGQRSSSEAASSRCSCRRRSATSIARSASTACRRVRTTTSPSVSACRARSWPTIACARRSAVSRDGPIWRRSRWCSRSARCSTRSR